MRMLHDIEPGNISAYIWATIIGANGRTLGGQGNMAHVFRVERTRPGRRERRYWSPWSGVANNLTTEERLTPLCGRIRTRSQYPRLSTIFQTSTWITRCAACQTETNRRGIDATYLDQVSAHDPWQALRRTTPEFWTHPDPVTGL
jgi:hypothetical protein